jgi:hypothetical protein
MIKYTTLYIYSVLYLSHMYEIKEFWRLSVGTETKKDESSTGRVWAAVFDHVTARSRFARVLKLINLLSL